MHICCSLLGLIFHGELLVTDVTVTQDRALGVNIGDRGDQTSDCNNCHFVFPRIWQYC